MTFLRPEYLYGLFALLIPIIIHLFNFRRHKKFYFSDISRLKTITNQTKKKKKLKHLVVLLLRLLTILFIVISLAGPIKDINKSKISNSSITTIYVDNSNSMMAEGQLGRIFETAKATAINIANQNTDNSSFIIVSNNTDPGQLRILDKESAVTEIEKLEISPESKRLSLMARIRDRISEKSNLSLGNTFIISDFQTYTTDIDQFEIDSSNHIFIPLEHLTKKNIYIDSCAIENPAIMVGENLNLSVWIKNHSETDYEKVPLKLMIDEEQKAVAGIDIKKGNTIKINLSFSVSNSGWHKGIIQIEDFPITFDDKFYFTFNVVDRINILIISENLKNTKLNNFYGSDAIFKIDQMKSGSIDLNDLKNYDLIVLNELQLIPSGTANQLLLAAQNGTNLLYIPPDERYLNNINLFLGITNTGSVIKLDTTKTRVKTLKLSNPIFSESIIDIPKNAELPTVNKHYKYLFPTASGVETLISLLSGDDFLSRKPIGKGNIYILSCGLENGYGNFTSQLLFAPVMHGIASKKESRIPLFYTLGETESVNIPLENQELGETPAKMFSLENKFSFIPRQKISNGNLRLELNNLKLTDGFYDVRYLESSLGLLAFNFNRKESELDFLSNDDLKQLCLESGLSNFEIINVQNPDFKEVINAMQKENDFWKLFIIFALFTLLLEVFVLRFWK